MVVAEEYALKYDKGRGGYIPLCWQQHTCPDCHAPLSGYDRRRRRAIDLEGVTRSYYLRRLRCAGCGRLHTEIPAFLLPHKQETDGPAVLEYQKKILDFSEFVVIRGDNPAEDFERYTSVFSHFEP